MEEKSVKCAYAKESLVGLVSASIAFIIFMALFSRGNFMTNLIVMPYMLLFFYATPFFSIFLARWLMVVFVIAGAVLFLQSRYVPARATRYLVFIEAVAWQVLGVWCADNVIAGFLSGR